ncbi:MAG: hypothetical protein ACYDBJ_28430 [Aggregatilineales bacterium]
MTTPGTALALRRGRLSGETAAPLPASPGALLAHHSDLTLRGLTLAVASVADVYATHTALSTLLVDLVRYAPQFVIMEDRLSGCTATGQIRQVRIAAPTARLIVLGDLYDGLYVADLLAASADAYLCQADTLAAVLPDAIRVVGGGEHYLSPSAATDYLAVLEQRQHGRRDRLDATERQVLALLLEGCDVEETMRRLDISRNRVYRLHQRVRHRFGVTTNAALIQRVLMTGLLVDGSH